ncbi:MAG: hypothetical protein AVDCRST_MAG85-959, partial [uncultured Solirubrobacteraceae bacterium]
WPSRRSRPTTCPTASAPTSGRSTSSRRATTTAPPTSPSASLDEAGGDAGLVGAP